MIPSYFSMRRLQKSSKENCNIALRLTESRLKQLSALLEQKSMQLSPNLSRIQVMKTISTLNIHLSKEATLLYLSHRRQLLPPPITPGISRKCLPVIPAAVVTYPPLIPIQVMHHRTWLSHTNRWVSSHWRWLLMTILRPQAARPHSRPFIETGTLQLWMWRRWRYPQSLSYHRLLQQLCRMKMLLS